MGMEQALEPFNCGRAAAAQGVAWGDCDANLTRSQRRLWLAGWLQHCVLRTEIAQKFQVKRTRDGASWTEDELALIEIGRRQNPRASYALLSAIFGRSESAVRVAACRLPKQQAAG